MSIEERLENIERLMRLLIERSIERQWYTVDQFAERVGKACFTCREWCRNGRIHAEKSMTQTGACTTWVISHDELLRYQRGGLLPIRPRRPAA